MDSALGNEVRNCAILGVIFSLLSFVVVILVPIFAFFSLKKERKYIFMIRGIQNKLEQCP